MTIKQKKLLRIISENLGKAGFTKTMYEMMLEAGYSEGSAKQQSSLLVGIKDELSSIVDGMETIRSDIMAEIKNNKNRISKANLRDLVDAVDKLTKNIQLLSGGKTGSEEVKISWEK